MAFKVTVKNGASDYKFNSATGQYDTNTTDRVEEFDTLAAALAEFLYYVDPEAGENDNKVSLTYVPKKDKKAKK